MKRAISAVPALIGCLLALGIHATLAQAMPLDADVRGGSMDTGSEPAASWLDDATRKQVLGEVATVIREHYADREAGEALAELILAQLKEGQFDSATDADGLVAQVMAVIRSRVPDRHFDFCVRGKREDDSDESSSRKRSPHGLRTVRMLEGDTAYLEFDGLPGDRASMKAVAQAMAELPEVQAIVFDLRNNIGGSGDMVVLLCSHLLEEGTLLYTYSDRSGDPPSEMRASAPQRHFGSATPVFVLTSAGTLSAAEALAYILQDYGRATLVGERTAGYAGVGVEPDMATPADSALDVAQDEIRRRLGVKEH
jgi:hypothetical protein